MAQLLFDMYGVLMRPATVQSREQLENFIAPPSPAKFWEAYEELRPAYDVGELSDTHYWEQVAALAGIAECDVAGAVEIDSSALVESDPAIVELVLQLIAREHAVGILSNVPATAAELVRAKHPWLEECAAVVFSCDIGVSKPDPEAYAVAIDALGGGKATYFFDDCADNVTAATKAGLRAHLFTGVNALRGVLADVS